MSFYSKLRLKLGRKMSKKQLEDLPRSYQIIGKLLLLKLRPSLYRKRKQIGKAVLDILPYVESVWSQKEIRGVKRKPKIEHLAGKKRTEVLHKEHGCRFLLDISKIMWSKGNKAEKMRLVSLVKPGETIVDMFAGVGYWSILLAKKTRARKIYAIDINPVAVSYLEKNIWLNKVEDKVEVLKGDCRKFARPLKSTADRVIMGYFPSREFLPSALKIAKKGAIVHFHDTVKAEDLGKLRQEMRKMGLKVRKTTTVKTYAPNVLHVVLDLRT